MRVGLWRSLVPKNWCFWTVVLEKTLESPLDCKEIQPVHPEGDQSWIFIGRTDVEADTLILWPPYVKNGLIWKDPDAGKDWRWEEKGMDDRGWDGWMASPTQWTCSVQFISVVSDSSWSHGPQQTRPPCPSPTPGVHPNPCPSSRWCHPTISSSVIPFSTCPQSFPALGSFPMSQLFTSGGQSIGVSASTSVLPMNIQGWFPLGWTSSISLQSKGLLIVFSNTTVQKQQFFSAQLSL